MSVTFARAVATETSGRMSIPLFGIVRIALGFVLLLAAGLKAYELASGPVAETSLLTSRWVGFAAVEIELLLGLWLLAGFWPRRLRWTALVWFAVLLGVSFSHAASGARSCACFGFVQVAPWLVAAFDFVALAALWFARPGDGAGISKIYSRRFVLAGFCLLYALFGVPVALAMWRGQSVRSLLVATPAVVDLGVVPRGGSAKAQFGLVNKGNQTVTIGQVESSCPCIHVLIANKVILPGQSQAAVLIFRDHNANTSTGSQTITIKAATNRGGLAFFVVAHAELQNANAVFLRGFAE